MKTKIALLSLTLIAFGISTGFAARPDARSTESSIERFDKMDLDHNSSIDETELFVELQSRESLRQFRIANLEGIDAVRAERMQARVEEESLDPMLGTPHKAAAFIVANFDSNGDWVLDREEIGQAFSTIRKWRSEGRTKTS